MLLSSTLRDDNATLTCDLTNPDLYEGGRLTLGHDLIHVRRSRFLWNAACFERLVVRNYDEHPRRLLIEIAFEADFADLFEVRGTRRARRGEDEPPELTANRVVLGYVGFDGKRRITSLTFDPMPKTLTGNGAVFSINLGPGEARSFFIEINCTADETQSSPRRAFFVALRGARRARQASAAPAVAVATDLRP